MTDAVYQRIQRSSYRYCPRCGVEITEGEVAFALRAENPAPPFCFTCFADIFAETRRAVIDGDRTPGAFV
jgi:RNA polymerase-binding transcription factor DksA